MEKTALAIEMLLLLKSRGILKKKEIADELEISEKMVQRLRNQLEIAGYEIASINGKYGGYQLQNGTLFPVSDLNGADLAALSQASGYLMSLSNPIINPEFKRAYSKIIANSSSTILEIESFHDLTLNFDPDRLNQYLNLLNEAIIRKHRIRFNYQKASKYKEYTFEPYAIFIVNNAWYTSGYIKHSHVATFKLNRMDAIEILNETYLKDETFTLNKHLNEFGFKIEKPIEIDCIITNHNYLQEYLIGDQQQIDVISDKQIHLKVTFYSHFKAKEFVLKYGSDIKILKPQSLIDLQKENAKRVLESI